MDKEKKEKAVELAKMLTEKADQVDKLKGALLTAVKHASEQFIAKLITLTDEIDEEEAEGYIGLGVLQKSKAERTTAMLLTNKADGKDGFFPVKLTVEFNEIMDEKQIAELAAKNQEYKDIDLVIPTNQDTADTEIAVADLTKEENSTWICPHCGEEMDYLASHPVRPPVINDVIVCAVCYQMGVLLENKTIRKATVHEIETVKQNNPNMWKTICEYKKMKAATQSQAN